jgi:tRNA G18 (ribose-2'-O)-methylase SpoU
MKRGYFAIGIERTKNELNVGTLWRSAHLFEAAFIFTIGRRYKTQASDTTKAWKSLPLVHYDTFEDFYVHMPHDCRLIGVELDPRAHALATFPHPERCIYLLGAEDHGLSKEAMRRCHAFVQLPGFSSMNVSAAGTCVLYDRHAKAVRAA